MEKRKKFLKFYLAPIVWAILIFTFSSFPTTKTTDFFLGDFLIKKTAHVIEYGILATLVFRALINSNIERKRAMFYSVLLAFFYGVTDEFHQSFTPGRGPSVRDVIIDTAGASILIYGVIGNINKLPSYLQKVYTKYIIYNAKSH